MNAEKQKRFFLLSMRCAILNLRSWESEIEACGVALKGGAITLDDAVAWMGDLGLVEHLPTPERIEVAA